jgi:hypothetical protein
MYGYKLLENVATLVNVITDTNAARYLYRYLAIMVNHWWCEFLYGDIWLIKEPHLKHIWSFNNYNYVRVQTSKVICAKFKATEFFTEENYAQNWSPNNVTIRIWGSHSGGYEEYHILGYNVVQSVESQPKFRRNISLPSSGSKNCLHADFLLSLFFSTLKMEAICFSETSVDSQRTTRSYIPEDYTFQCDHNIALVALFTI